MRRTASSLLYADRRIREIENAHFRALANISSWHLQVKTGLKVDLRRVVGQLRRLICLFGQRRPINAQAPGMNPAQTQSISALSPRRENKVKTIKMIGLAALAALMAMAFATSASATTLCNSDTAPCGSATTSVHEVSVGKAKLLTSFGTTECNVLFSSTSVGAGGGTVQKLEGNFTYTNCTLGGSSCSATEESGPTEIKIERTGHETAKVTGEGLVHLVCGSSIDCSYNGTNLVGTGKGPLLSTQANGEVSLSEQATTKETGGFLCPKTAKLDITTSPLAATYIAVS